MYSLLLIYPLVNVYKKLWKDHLDPSCSMGKLTIVQWPCTSSQTVRHYHRVSPINLSYNPIICIYIYICMYRYHLQTIFMSVITRLGTTLEVFINRKCSYMTCWQLKSQNEMDVWHCFTNKHWWGLSHNERQLQAVKCGSLLKKMIHASWNGEWSNKSCAFTKQ